MSKKNEAQKLQEELICPRPILPRKRRSRKKRHLSTARDIRNF